MKNKCVEISICKSSSSQIIFENIAQSLRTYFKGHLWITSFLYLLVISKDFSFLVNFSYERVVIFLMFTQTKCDRFVEDGAVFFERQGWFFL